MKGLFLALILSFLSSIAYSECGTLNCSSVKINKFYITLDGHTIISTTGKESNLSCDAGPSGYIALNPEKGNYNSVYSLLLVAFTTDLTVSLRLNGSGACELLYVVVDK